MNGVYARFIVVLFVLLAVTLCPGYSSIGADTPKEGIEIGQPVHTSGELIVEAQSIRQHGRGPRHDYVFAVTFTERDVTDSVQIEGVLIEPHEARVEVFDANHHIVIALSSLRWATVMAVVDKDIGEQAEQLEAHDSPVISPDGRRMAYSSFIHRRTPSQHVRQTMLVYDFAGAAPPVRQVFPVEDNDEDMNNRRYRTDLAPPLWDAGGDELVFLASEQTTNTMKLVRVTDMERPVVHSRVIEIAPFMYREDRRRRYFGPDATREPLEWFGARKLEWIDAATIKAYVAGAGSGMLKEELVLELP